MSYTNKSYSHESYFNNNIKKLGKIGDKVSVKPGYARNYLFPNNMALEKIKKILNIMKKLKMK